MGLGQWAGLDCSGLTPLLPSVQLGQVLYELRELGGGVTVWVSLRLVLEGHSPSLSSW